MIAVIFLCSALPRRLSFVPKNGNGGLSDGGVLMLEEQDEAVLDHFPGNLICQLHQDVILKKRNY
jgi:hypothetical protein